MTGFDAIIGQPVAVGVLQAFLTTGAIPHALLFNGIPGVGRMQAARLFAAACNCNLRVSLSGDGSDTPLPCGSCRACRKIESDQHPDVITIRPSGATFRVDQIRSLIKQMGLKPYEAKQRVIIMESADLLNASAGNALLKLLEEPPKRTLFCLMAPNSADVLPTIVSRCTVVRFRPLTPAEITPGLIDDGVSPGQAQLAANAAAGSPLRARRLLDGEWGQLSQEVIAVVNRSDPLPAPHQHAWASHWSDSRDRALTVVDVLIGWCRDVAVHRWRPEDDSISGMDSQDAIIKASSRDGTTLAAARYRMLIRARRRIEANANPRIALESVLIEWFRQKNALPITGAPWCQE